MSGNKLSAEHHSLWIKTVLAVNSSEPQRRAFIDGYNGAATPPHSSVRMLELHALGSTVSALLRTPTKAPDHG